MNESRQEKQVREALAPYLVEDEELIAVTSGFMGGGGFVVLAMLGLLGRKLYNSFFAKKVYLGVTPQRLLLVDRKSSELQDFPLQDLNVVEFDSNMNWLSSNMPGKLRLKTAQTNLEVGVDGKKWKEMSDVFAYRAQRAIKQIK